MSLKMMVETDDWNELHETLKHSEDLIEKYRKALENLCTDFNLVIGSGCATDSNAYKEAIKLI
jgi:hypothetical protein